MNSPSTSMLASMGIGGVVISSLGAASMYAMEKKKPTVKSTLRDYIIEAILILFVLQLLPDSAQTIVDSVGSVGTLFSGVIENASSVTSDMEIQVGVPKF